MFNSRFRTRVTHPATMNAMARARASLKEEVNAFLIVVCHVGAKIASRSATTIKLCRVDLDCLVSFLNPIRHHLQLRQNSQSQTLIPASHPRQQTRHRSLPLPISIVQQHQPRLPAKLSNLETSFSR